MNTKNKQSIAAKKMSLLCFKKPNLKSLLFGFLLCLGACAPKAENTSQNQKISLTNSEYKIIGGTKVESNEDMNFTIVGLYDTKMKAICTGSLISDSVVLTAAHCVESGPENIKVIFSNDLKAKNLVWKNVVNISVSEFWTSNRYLDQDTGDIALLSFTGGIPSGYHPVKILPTKYGLKIGDKVTLAGYGISNGVTGEGTFDLKKTEVKISETHFGKTEMLFDQREGKGACHGDSGGPAYVSIEGELYLFGITSRGNDDPDNDCSHFAVYTNVLTYDHWMNETQNKIQIVTQAKK